MSVCVSKFRMKGMPFSWFVFVYKKWHEDYCRLICCFLWGHEVPETTTKMLILYCVGSASVYQMLEWSCALHWRCFSKVSDKALFWWSHDSTHSQTTKNIRTGFQLTVFWAFGCFSWIPLDAVLYVLAVGKDRRHSVLKTSYSWTFSSWDHRNKVPPWDCFMLLPVMSCRDLFLNLIHSIYFKSR